MLSADHKLLVTMEENVRSGGYGEKVMDYVVEQETISLEWNYNYILLELQGG